MPAVNTWLAPAPSPIPAEAHDHAAPGFSDSRGSGEDFDSLMQSKLAPDKLPVKNGAKPQAARPEPEPTPNGSPAGPAARAVQPDPDEKDAGGKTSAPAGREASSNSPAAAEGNNSTDANAAVLAAGTANPVPVLASLPQLSGGAWLAAAGNGVAGTSGTIPGMSGGSGNETADGSLNKTPAGAAKGQAAAANALPVADLKPVAEALTLGLDAAKALTGAGQDAEKSANAAAANSAASAAAEPGDKSVPPLTVKPADPRAMEKLPEAGTPGAAGQTAENAGTGVAISDSPMKNPQKMNEVAGLDAKVLPVGGESEGREKNLPTQFVVPIVHATETSNPDLNFGFNHGDAPAALTENTQTVPVDLPLLNDARMRALDRTHDMVALHAMRLMESKSDALTVMIKPSVGTELSLDLRQREGGGVEVQATLVKGDHGFLSEHWAELQQRLEQRGIKLGALGGEGDVSANHDDRQFQQQPHAASQEEEARQASAFAEFAVASQGGATARMAAAYDGWESWA